MSSYNQLSLFIPDLPNTVSAPNITMNMSINFTDQYSLTSTLTPEEILFINSIGYRFKMIMSDPHNIISVILGFIAVFSNVLSLLALTQVKSSIGSYFKLLMSLSMSDILIGITLIMHKVSKVLNLPYRAGLGPPKARLRSRCIFMVIKALNTTALNSTLLNLMAMAIDHYIAILKPLHYHIYVNNRRKYIIIGVAWVIAIVLGFSDFFSGFHLQSKYSNMNYCEVIWISLYQEEFCTFALAFVCFVIMTFIYGRIYCEVRKQLQRDSQSKDLKKNKKALITTLLILGSFVICWLPTSVFQIAMVIQVKVDYTKVQKIFAIFYKADKYLMDLLTLNAICDPVIYALRMREVRIGYRVLFHRCCKCICKKPAKRRYSESMTMDFNMSMIQRKSVGGISNGSTIKKNDNQTVTSQSCQSFSAALPQVNENNEQRPRSYSLPKYTKIEMAELPVDSKSPDIIKGNYKHGSGLLKDISEEHQDCNDDNFLLNTGSEKSNGEVKSGSNEQSLF